MSIAVFARKSSEVLNHTMSIENTDAYPSGILLK